MTSSPVHAAATSVAENGASGRSRHVSAPGSYAAASGPHTIISVPVQATGRPVLRGDDAMVRHVPVWGLNAAPRGGGDSSGADGSPHTISSVPVQTLPPPPSSLIGIRGRATVEPAGRSTQSGTGISGGTGIAGRSTGSSSGASSRVVRRTSAAPATIRTVAAAAATSQGLEPDRRTAWTGSLVCVDGPVGVDQPGAPGVLVERDVQAVFEVSAHRAAPS